jgi:hypothetical protein
VAHKTKKGKYTCSYCNKEYDTPTLADKCRDGHDLVFVPFSREDINRLAQFIVVKEDKLLTETLVKSILKYRRPL